MTAEEILDAIASDSLIALHNRGDGWAIEFKTSTRGVKSTDTIFNATLDKLIELFANILEADEEKAENSSRYAWASGAEEGLR